MSTFDIPDEVAAAEQRIRPLIRETPLEESLWLGELSRGEVWLKLENLQRTGSFKLRGAANKLLSLTSAEKKRGIVTASTGNHGTAVATLLRQLGWRGAIYVPQTVSAAKLSALRLQGAELHLHGTDGVEAELEARRVAEREGRVYVSPYNDPLIVAGQGTVGLEIDRQLETIDAVLVPVGGGGLMAGVAGWLKSRHPQIEIVGCQPRNSAVMYHSLEAGHIVDLVSEPTLADGTAGGVEHDTMTFPICRDLIDRFVLLEEAQIAAAIRAVLEKHHLLIEGAAALSVAALIAEAERYRGRHVVLILSGARLSLDSLRQILH